MVPTSDPDLSFLPEGCSRPAANGLAWIRGGFELFRRQPGTWIGLMLLWFVLNIALGMLPVVGSVVNQVLTPVFVAGMMIAAREAASGRTLSVSMLFAGFSTHTGALAAVGGLSLVAIVIIVAAAWIGFSVDVASWFSDDLAPERLVPLLTALMLVLLLLVPVYMAIWFAPALIVFNGLRVRDALRGSFLGCLGNPASLLVYGLASIGLAIVAAIPLGLGFIVLAPVFAASVYVSYRDIFHET